MGELFLFVVPAPGSTIDEDTRRKVSAALRGQLSPRHVPDSIVEVPAIPSTLTGKKLELPVKRILLGARAEDVAKRDALIRPDALDAFVSYATARGA